MFETDFFSEPGPKGNNQDSVLIFLKSDSSIVLAIADGLGGKPYGEIASSLATDTISNELKENSSILIEEMFSSVFSSLKAKATENKSYAKMATTLTICVIEEGKVLVGHVGDCRIYHLRNEGILTRTKDQTERQKLIDERVITLERAEFYHRKNVLLSVMSANTEYQLELNEFPIEKKDRILLLTDGAYERLEKIKIIDMSLSSKTVKEFNCKLKESIESRGVVDDYSIIATEII